MTANDSMSVAPLWRDRIIEDCRVAGCGSMSPVIDWPTDYSGGSPLLRPALIWPQVSLVLSTSESCVIFFDFPFFVLRLRGWFFCRVVFYQEPANMWMKNSRRCQPKLWIFLYHLILLIVPWTWFNKHILDNFVSLILTQSSCATYYHHCEGELLITPSYNYFENILIVSILPSVEQLFS